MVNIGPDNFLHIVEGSEFRYVLSIAPLAVARAIINGRKTARENMQGDGGRALSFWGSLRQQPIPHASRDIAVSATAAFPRRLTK